MDEATLRDNLASYLPRVTNAELAVVLSQLGLELWRRGVSGNVALHQAASELEHRARVHAVAPAEPFPVRPPLR